MLIVNIGQLVTPTGNKACCGKTMSQLQILENAFVKIVNGKIIGVDQMRALVRPRDEEIFDAHHGVAIPGLVDPHTHAAFIGAREEEYLARCRGEKYGKGILTSVEKVRKSSEDEIFQHSKSFLLAMMRQGSTTVEIKSGYGLNTESELKLLKVIKKFQQELPIEIVSTFCGAHAVPADKKKSDYISEIIGEMIPQVKKLKLAEYCDVFTEKGFFSIDESREILRAAQGAGFKLKIHADELSPLGGSELAAELSATSADHLLHISARGIKKMKKAGTVPVLLPGTAFSLNAEYAPAREMIEAELPVALGTDFNPGTCLIHSMSFIIALAVRKMRMTIEESLTAATLNAAAALDRADQLGSLEVGKKGDVVILALDNYRQIPYFMGHDFVRTVVKSGQVIYDKQERNEVRRK
ncbi:imidazolonepropionase [Candidatus Acetothermia bacterium]|nr:imidazolonepropionase [Candidatus Acetothermia bacterium]MBI3460692.1 imidazolonepropionase [Candidatus Acetothermia bacterium]MBI3660357.1 imidazolonepropionase [Candidatus Acetothermia bacterium]